jgi:phage terminase Nu1 subunit (DNA packaging protein)
VEGIEVAADTTGKRGKWGGKRRGSGRRGATGESYEAARRRKETALADLREQEVKKRREESVDIEEVARAWGAVAREVRSGVMAVTSRIRARLPHLTAHDASVIDEELRAALQALADDRTPDDYCCPDQQPRCHCHLAPLAPHRADSAGRAHDQRDTE